MNDVAEFLLARIAEDEHFGTHDRHLAARWPAECEAKRRIVELHAGGGGVYCDACADGLWNLERAALPCPTLRLLALPYADHADYRRDWRP